MNDMIGSPCIFQIMSNRTAERCRYVFDFTTETTHYTVYIHIIIRIYIAYSNNLQFYTSR